MKQAFTLVLGLGLALGSIGCEESRCDVALGTIEDKATECGLPYADSIDPGQGTCEDADAAELEQQADCTEAASCAALDGSDTAGNRVFSECVSSP